MSLLGLMSCLLFNAGCASRTAYVIARQSPQYQLSRTNKIAIADHAQPREEEQSLRAALILELRQEGFDLVAPGEAEYTLTYWIDESWKPGKIVVSNREGTWADPGRASAFRDESPWTTFSGGQPGPYRKPAPSKQRVMDVPFATQGIRLKMFRQESMRAGRLQTAWDGYIEGGDQVSKTREPVLLRTLLNYLGKDFVGRAKLIKTPPTNQR